MRVKAFMLSVLMILMACVLHAQTPTQIKYIIPTTTTLTFAWDYNTADEVSMEAFVIQRTQFATTSTITSPYALEQTISQKSARTITYALPTGLTAGQKAFFGIITRKQGIADSPRSNIVQVEIVVVAPSPTNFRIQ